MFKRPSEEKILDNHIYEARRMLTEAEFKYDHAKVAAESHRQQVMMMESRVNRLVAAREALVIKEPGNDAS